MTMTSLDEIKERISSELEDRVIPFWMSHSIDKKHGGYFNNIDDEGIVFDTTKHMWLQSREVYMWSTLHFDALSRGDKESAGKYLNAATVGAKFIREHGLFGEDKDRVYFAVTQEGAPLQIQRKPWAECFYVLACILYGRAAKDKEFEEEGLRMFTHFTRYCNEPSLLGKPSLPGAPGYLELGVAMFALSVIDEIRCGGKKEGEINKSLYAKEAEDAICNLRKFIVDERKLVFERVLADESGPDLKSSNGRLLTPGHAIEGGWFVLQFAMKYFEKESKERKELEEIGLKMIRWSYKNGWDEKFGGIFYFTDSEGFSPLPLESPMKLWWVHCEAMVACLYAHLVSGSSEDLERFVQVTNYTLDHFAKTPKGGWYGYCDRRGDLTHKNIAAPYKGFFHVPRALMVVRSLLQKLS